MTLLDNNSQRYMTGEELAAVKEVFSRYLRLYRNSSPREDDPTSVNYQFVNSLFFVKFFFVKSHFSELIDQF